MLKQGSFDAVIFDMDGVLIDSEPLWKIAMERAFHEAGCQLTKKDFQVTVGMRIDEVVQYWYKEVGWKNHSPELVEKRIIEHMLDLIAEKGKALPGVMETLQYLKESAASIALASSSYMVLIRAVLDSLGATEYFDCIHSAEFETFGKPHPAVYLSTAAMLKLPPKNCLVIEDSFNGIIAGKAAGMKVVCIPEKTHHHDQPKRLQAVSDFFFSDMNEFLNELKHDTL